MSLVSHLKRTLNADCLTRRCRKNKCSLTLNHLPDPHILVDMDHKKAPRLREGNKKCDYIFVCDDNDEALVAPLELKGGTFGASDVVEQLQAGAGVADSIVPSTTETRFRPIVVHGRGIHRAELERLQKRRVRYRNRNYPVGKARCGTSLVEALNKAQGA